MLPAQARRQCENFFIDNEGCFLRGSKNSSLPSATWKVSPLSLFFAKCNFLSLFHNCSRQESAEFRVVR